MKNILLTFLLASSLFACQENKPAAGNAAQKPQPAPGTTEQRVIYQDCAVYAASTDFAFTDENGERLLVNVPNLPQERTIKIPGNLTDPNAVEGPPGANPALVGKPFLLVKNEKGEVIEIKPAE